MRKVGKMVLDQNIDNFHNESEQIAFNPGTVVPGDKNLHGVVYCTYMVHIGLSLGTQLLALACVGVPYHAHL